LTSSLLEDLEFQKNSQVANIWRQVVFQIQLINAVVEWEWRLKIEEEKRKNLKGEPNKNSTGITQPYQNERKSISMQTVERGRVGQPGPCRRPCDPCWEAESGH
jgi:hypothetical protein